MRRGGDSQKLLTHFLCAHITRKCFYRFWSLVIQSQFKSFRGGLNTSFEGNFGDIWMGKTSLTKKIPTWGKNCFGHSLILYHILALMTFGSRSAVKQPVSHFEAEIIGHKPPCVKRCSRKELRRRVDGVVDTEPLEPVLPSGTVPLELLLLKGTVSLELGLANDTFRTVPASSNCSGFTTAV